MVSSVVFRLNDWILDDFMFGLVGLLPPIKMSSFLYLMNVAELKALSTP